jgi:hypothetical protein
MSMLWIAALLVSAPTSENSPAAVVPAPTAASATATSEKSAAPVRTGRVLENAVHQALRHWARPRDSETKQAAQELIGLYRELQRDTSLTKDDRTQLRLMVRSRLVSLAQQISRHAAREARLAGSNAPQHVGVAKADAVLSQVGMGMPGAGMQGGGAGNNNGPDDAGPDLVDLIQKTISPATWDVNGGPGSIYYWRNQRAIVVSAPGEVHEEIGGLLEQMDRLGR